VARVARLPIRLKASSDFSIKVDRKRIRKIEPGLPLRGWGRAELCKAFLYETASCRSEKEQKTEGRENFGISFEEIPARELA